MDSFAVLASIEAKTGQEAAVAALLASAEVPGSGHCHAFQLGPSTFGIFATFGDEDGCRGFAEQGIGKTLLDRTEELLAWPPRIDRASLIAP